MSKMKLSDNTILEKVLQNIKQLEEFVADTTTFEKFSADEKTKHACTMVLINIGELLSHLSDGFKNSHPELPHAKATGLRNVAAHGYHRLKFEFIWETINKSIPELKKQIEKLLKEK